MKSYDMEKMKAALLAEGFRFSLFGGEALLLPIEDMRELFRWGKEQFGEISRDYYGSPNGIQTNASLMTEEHIAIFKEYDVGVGVSLDGDEDLNDLRWMGSVERTREATAHSNHMLRRLLEERIPTSLIVTVHAQNARGEQLERLAKWLRDLSVAGLRYVNFHLLEIDMEDGRENHRLTKAENVEVLRMAMGLMETTPLTCAPISDMISLLRGRDQWGKTPEDVRYLGGTNCTWNACDPYTTHAVHSVDGQGNRGNCGRVAKDGVTYVKASRDGYERQLSLYYTPMAYEGCGGCRFFFACKGNCPGEGLQGDWRGKTEHCATLMETFETLELFMLERGERPLSLSPDRNIVEQRMLEAWKRGQNISITRALRNQQPVSENVPHGDTPHGDHTDAVKPVIEHGDHTDSTGGGLWSK